MNRKQCSETSAPQAVTAPCLTAAPAQAAPTSPIEEVDFPTQAITWTIHPAAQKPGRTLAVLGVIAVFAGAVWMETGGVGWPLFAAAILTASLNRYFLRTRFTVDSEGVTAEFPFGRKNVPWSRMRLVRMDDAGCLLSDTPHASVRDHRRAIPVTFPPGESQPREILQRALARRLAWSG